MRGDQLATVARNDALRLTRRQRDFLLLNIFVLVQNGHNDRASVLADAMYLSGENDTEVHLARAVLRFARRLWEEAIESLDQLDRIDPIERFGTYRLNNRQRMRRYLKARCLFELGESSRMRDALDSYLRHGTKDVEGLEWRSLVSNGGSS